jgi:hypothetical protein
MVIYLDNGPDNSGKRTQFLKRMERCWSALEKKWNGVLLNCWEVQLDAT